LDTVRLFNLARQINGLKNEIDAAFWDVMSSGQFILGEHMQRFEAAFATYLESRYAVGVGSGTGALMLAYLAVGLEPGDRIITTPTTYVATAMAAAVNGGIPEFVDILPESGRMDTNQLYEKLNKARRGGTLARYRAIVPVHLYGYPENMQEILKIAGEFDVPVIEDACQAHGGSFSLGGARHVKAGTAGVMGCFSFYPTKNLGCFGDGGMVVTNDNDLAEKLRMLRNYGQKEVRHKHLDVAASNRLDEIQAAWLQVKLPFLDTHNERRRRIAAIYTDRFRDLPVTLPPVEGQGDYSVFHLYAIRTDKRAALISHLSKNGIDTAIHYPIPIHLQPAFGYLGLGQGTFPHAERLEETVLSLPMYPELTDQEVNRVVLSVREFFQR
jgi:dTDP-4-amino-4,6-dideoxygalactose transaminase